MANYKILIKPSAAKELEVVPKLDCQRITERILSLSENPRPIGAVKMTGMDRCRIRQGDYRILYEIHDREVVVIVVKVGNRREVYR